MSDAVLLALVYLVFLQGVGPVAWEIAMSSIYGPPAECNTPLHFWLTLKPKKVNTRVQYEIYC
jgi:hypothetical protein